MIGLERRSEPLLSRTAFARRVALSVVLAIGLILISLIVGMIGYHHFENMSWIDAFANASMILSGMGPLATLQSESGKIFAGCYAIYSGLVVILVTGLILGPPVHRMLHKFHLDDEDEK